MIAVLTGDVVASSRISVDRRREFIEILRAGLDAGIFSSTPENPGVMETEIFRGDSFQLAIQKPELSLYAALILMLRLRVLGSKAGLPIESRIGIGIGEVDFKDPSQALGTWSGSAFELAGRSLLEITLTSSRPRLGIGTPWGSRRNEGLNASLGLLSFVVERWTDKECEALLGAFLYKNQSQIGRELGITQSAVSQRLQSGGWWASRDFEKEIRRQLTEQTRSEP
ncbi:hypothetical protein H8E52_10375 [bacterium]|nr:hypothetical protein [bacterium]